MHNITYCNGREWVPDLMKYIAEALPINAVGTPLPWIKISWVLDGIAVQSERYCVVSFARIHHRWYRDGRYKALSRCN